jgi:hypothetical protein
MRVRFVKSCYLKGQDGVIREYAVGAEADLSLEEAKSFGSMVVLLETEPVVESFDEAPADKMVRHGKHK